MRRDTLQNRAIKRVISEANRPLTPTEIRHAAEVVVPGIGMATIYRAIRRLSEESWLVPIQVPGEPARYERAGKKHHHHFSCRICGRMYDFEGCPGRMESLAPPGFIMESHELFLFGRCAECSNAA